MKDRSLRASRSVLKNLQWNLLNNKGEPIEGTAKKQFMEESLNVLFR